VCPAAAVDDWPPVSVILPVLNEERHLRDAVGSILGQDYPGELEVVLALGPSRDRTDAVAADLAARDPRIRTVRNPTGRTPEGLNRAIGASRHAVVARVDGHAELPDDYLRVAVETLRRTGADNVGGLMWAEGRTDFERAVARAMTSKLGVGNAPFHVGGDEGPADSVYLGVFRRDALDRVGGYDEVFSRAQDWEMNYRIRSTGGTVWFNPALRVAYRPRGTLRALASQYYHYGHCCRGSGAGAARRTRRVGAAGGLRRVRARCVRRGRSGVAAAVPGGAACRSGHDAALLGHRLRLRLAAPPALDPPAGEAAYRLSVRPRPAALPLETCIRCAPKARALRSLAANAGLGEKSAANAGLGEKEGVSRRRSGRPRRS
jgi:hypothetical protein